MIRLGFLNIKGGVGKTTLVYHLGHMLAELGRRPLLMDLDPQAALTTMCVRAQRLEELWPDSAEHPLTISGCIPPVVRRVDEIREPHVEPLGDSLGLVPGDLWLSTFEDRLSEAWTGSLDGEDAFHALSTIHRVAELAAAQHGADLVLFDLGPNLGALNRAALGAADFVVSPLSSDPFAGLELRSLGQLLADWRRGWTERLARHPESLASAGHMEPLGYVVTQTATHFARQQRMRERWISGVPREYHRWVLGDDSVPDTFEQDPWCLGVMRHYHGLVVLARDAGKPMFHLKPADGAVGSHMALVRRCYDDFESLARKLLDRAEHSA